MQSDVKALDIVATGQTAPLGGAARLVGYSVETGAGGQIVWKTGGVAGTTLFTSHHGADMFVDVPGQGVRFKDGIHATLTTVTGLVVYYTG